MSVTIECVHEAGALIGEGAVWDVADQLLYWVDIDGGLLHRFDPSRGALEPHDVGCHVGCIALRGAGGAVIALTTGLATYDFATSTATPFAAPEEGRPQNRYNDGATDRDGRWWVGSVSLKRPQPAEAAFYRVDADRSVTKWLGDIYTTNGMAFSPDGRTMYLSDSFPEVRTIWVCDYDRDTGTPTNRRPFLDTRTLAGRPDGATVDADGCYWFAGVSGWQVYRVTPAGEVDLTIDMPVERPSRPMFGGPDLTTLYVTSIAADLTTPPDEQPLAGGLFAITGLPVGGVPEVRFAG